MGIFSRFKDIVSSNLNAMLDKAEDPEKMIKLMINEMEETLVEIKASCAGAMADQKKVEKLLGAARSRAEDWKAKAELAIDKGREDLAREALVEKNRLLEAVENFDRELSELDQVVARYREDMSVLEEKLDAARKKHRVLVQRQIQAVKSQKTSQAARRSDSLEAVSRFDRMESRIERMEAEAELDRASRSKSPTLDDQFHSLIHDEKIEKELQDLKSRKQQ
jgi:phage shock protein A